jgi:hypothetical protein
LLQGHHFSVQSLLEQYSLLEDSEKKELSHATFEGSQGRAADLVECPVCYDDVFADPYLCFIYRFVAVVISRSLWFGRWLARMYILFHVGIKCVLPAGDATLAPLLIEVPRLFVEILQPFPSAQALCQGGIYRGHFAHFSHRVLPVCRPVAGNFWPRHGLSYCTRHF